MGIRLGRSIALGLVVALIVGAGVATAAGPYPNPLPDFAHPGSPHAPLYSVTGGNLDRPLLVVYVEFTDFKFPSNRNAAFMAQRFFGPFPSVAGYYAANSFGKLNLTPAAETDTAGGGAVNDGVVEVSIPMTEAAFRAQTQVAAEENKQMIQPTDAFVNFAAFDTNPNDGKLTNSELLIIVVKALPANNCGANFGVNPLTLDGKSIALGRVALVGLGANVITLVHEMWHEALDGYDIYGYGVGSFDIGGPTCGGADDQMFAVNAWQKTHFGWITPTVVTQDGYYNVRRADTTGDAFILYDPSRGVDDYFIVENREPTTGTYDEDASDSGLVIWRVDESKWGNGTLRAVEIMRPDGASNPPCNNNNVCYSGNTSDAWNPGDIATPQRTMNRKWRDGSDALVAVRAIGNAGSVMRAYFDVRGPGVLVDTFDLAQTLPLLTLGEAGAVSFPVMNTGEATDTFDFTATNLPNGWTATTDTQTLGAGVGSTATVKITPPLSGPSNLYFLSATGVSQSDSSITSTSPFRVFARRRDTVLQYTGALTADYHDPAALSATLTDQLSGNPLSGKTIEFELGTQKQTAVTDSSGVATASIFITQAPAAVSVSATFLGDVTYLPSDDKQTFTITREETTTTYIGPTVILQGASGVTLKAQLLEEGTTAPVPSGQTITLSLGAQSCTGTADASGIASCTLIFNGALGPQPLKAEFAGDTYYEPSSDTGKTAIVFAFPSYGAFMLGDDTVAAATPSTVVTWWDSNWSAASDLSGGDNPPAFKGFADNVVSLPTTSPAANCKGIWTTRSGNSAPPTTGVPSYMGVLVTSQVTKSGATITGDFSEIVVVITDPGYRPGPGHSGTGRIVATFCP